MHTVVESVDVTSTGWFTAAALGVWVGAFVASRVAGRWSAATFDGPDLAAVLRGLRRTGYVIGTVVVLVGWRLLDGDSVVAATVDPRATGLHSVATTLALGTVWLGVVLGVTLGTVPYRRRARGYDLTHRFVARWLLSRGVGSLAVVATAVAVVSAVPGGLPRFAATLAIVTATTLVLPFTLALGLRARRPTPAEAGVVDDLLPDVVDLRVVDDRTRVGPAFAAGTWPGRRTVFVTAAVFDVCTDVEVRAVVAHEVAHHRQGHVALRQAVVGAGVVPVLAAFEFGAGVPAWTLLLAVPYAVVVAWTFRRTEYRADVAAARAVGPDALCGAFDALAAHRLVLADSTPGTRLFEVHPTIASRKRRLRAL